MDEKEVEFIRLDNVKDIHFLDLSGVPAEIKRKTQAEMMTFGYCIIVRYKDGKFEVKH